jgi:hypothetical protein
MCGVPQAMLGLQVVSSLSGAMSGADAAQQQMDAASSNLNNQLYQNSVKQVQVNAQATDKMSQRARDAELANGRINAVSGESGIALNGDVLSRDSEMSKGMDMATIESNRKNGIVQTEWDAQTYKSQAQDRINKAQSSAPTLLGTGLQIAGAGLDYYGKTIPKAGG